MAEDYQRLSASIDDLSRTLLEGHPRLRIAQLRLADLAAEIETEARELAAATAAEREALQVRLTGLETQITRLDAAAERRQAAVRERRGLEAELALAEDWLAANETGLPPAAAPQPLRAWVISTGEASAREAPAPVLLVTALAGLSGLVVGGAGVALSGLIARPPVRIPPAAFKPTSAPSGAAAVPLPVQPTSAGQPKPVAPSCRETIALDDVAAALLKGPVSRVLIAAAGDVDGEPLSLSLARRLADADSLVLLVDLSPAQLASHRAGVPRGIVGFHEIAAGQVGLSAASIGDEGSAADIVAGGRLPDQVSGRAGVEALHFARKAYDHVLVDCGRLPASQIIGLADEECAVLMPAGGANVEALTDRLRELAAAGLDTVILIG